jgi:hypothetical protein
MREEVETLFRLYDEQCRQARQHEDHREKVVQLTIAIAAALAAVISANDFDPWTLPLAMAIVFLAIYSATFCFKHYERNRHHVKYARNYRRKIEDLVDQIPLSQLRRDARAEHDGEYPRSSCWRLHRLWLGLNYGIGAIGLIVATIIVFKWANNV